MLRLRTLAEDGDKQAERTVRVAERFNKLLATILIGNNIVNISLSSFVTYKVSERIGAGAVAIATGVTTLVVLTFGEIMPKSIAKDNAEKWALAVSGVMQFLMAFFTPLSCFFLWLDRLFHKNGTLGDKAPTMTEQEFKYMLDTIEEEGVLESKEKELVESALDFYDSTVQEIVTPRVDITALDVDDDKEEILKTIMDERFSRLPVYEENIDNIIGVVQARDIMESLLNRDELDLRALMAEPMYVHRTLKISKLLGDFQKNKTHMAVVIDDYGGTLGIVTMEDLLEELVGEIWDEDEEIVQELTDLPNGEYEVSGEMECEDFFDHIGYEPKDEPEAGWNTINGWALEHFDHIPKEGESFVDGPLEVTVKEMDEQRISKLHIVYRPESPAEEE